MEENEEVISEEEIIDIDVEAQEESTADALDIKEDSFISKIGSTNSIFVIATSAYKSTLPSFLKKLILFLSRLTASQNFSKISLSFSEYIFLIIYTYINTHFV